MLTYYGGVVGEPSTHAHIYAFVCASHPNLYLQFYFVRYVRLDVKDSSLDVEFEIFCACNFVFLTIVPLGFYALWRMVEDI